MNLYRYLARNFKANDCWYLFPLLLCWYLEITEIEYLQLTVKLYSFTGREKVG